MENELLKCDVYPSFVECKIHGETFFKPCYRFKKDGKLHHKFVPILQSRVEAIAFATEELDFECEISGLTR